MAAEGMRQTLKLIKFRKSSESNN